MTAWLFTWLWQGTILAVAVAAVLGWTSRLNAATKHLIWCAALAALVWLGVAALPYGGLTPVPVPGSDPIYVPEPMLYVPSAPDTFVSAFLGIWAALVLLNLIRLLPGIRGVFALRDRCRPIPHHLESQLPLWLEARGRGRRADLMICDEVTGATVLGLQRPYIALPPSLVEALAPDELDQVILHEHAHVQRRDDWLRLAERLVLAAVCIHPAALLIARELNRQREMACDEWVVDRTGLPKAYARCLAHAAEVGNRIRGRAALMPALFGVRPDLTRRVDRLLAIKGRTRSRVSLLRATAAAWAMTIAAVQLQGVRAAEIAAVVFPIDLVQRIEWIGQADEVPVMEQTQVAQAMRGVPQPEPVPQMQQARPVEGVRDARELPEIVPEGVNSAESTPLLAGGSLLFAQTASAPIAPVAPSALSTPSAPNPPVVGDSWRVLAAPGIEIASAAKKTSVGIANALGRAGVSLARSF